MVTLAKCSSNGRAEVIRMSTQNAALLSDKAQQMEETVEQFLARGGRIQRIEDHPDPDGRVLLRGQHFNAGQVRPWAGISGPGPSKPHG
jgi:hypothetical protein